MSFKRSVYSAKLKHHGKNGYLKRPSLRPFVRVSLVLIVYAACNCFNIEYDISGYF